MSTSTNNDRFKDFPVIGAVMASKMIVDEGKKIVFMSRQKPANEQDSGWRLFCGLETQEYVNDPTNVGIFDPKEILAIDDSIEELLLAPRGSVFEREDENSNWCIVDSYPMADDYLTTHQLTDNWSIEINNMFDKHHKNNDDIIFSMEDKTVRIAIWEDKGKYKEALYLEHKNIINNRDQDFRPTLESYEFKEEQVLRVGYRVEEKHEDKTYQVIYGFCLIDECVVQVAFYFDEPEDKEWAVQTWQKIQYTS